MVPANQRTGRPISTQGEWKMEITYQSEVIGAKYLVGQIVWFYTHASVSDTIVTYPCVGRGRITKIYPAGIKYGYLAGDEILYSMQESGSYMFVKESNIYPDAPDEAIERLSRHWESEWKT